MKKLSSFNYYLLTLGLILSSFAFTGCEEDDSFGLDLLPGSDIIYGYLDTNTSIKGYTFFDDSIRSDEGIYSSGYPYNLLGSYVDPVFGFAKADFITDLRLSSNYVNFGDSLVADSLILYMKVASTYGEFRQFGSTDIKVYRLKDTISYDSEYYSNLDISELYDLNQPIGSASYYPSTSDSLIRIVLDTTNIVSILTDTTKMIDTDTFRMYFPGLYITAEDVSQGGQILSLDMAGTESRVAFYYHYLKDEETPFGLGSNERVFSLLINENSARVNRFSHDYNQAWTPIQGIDDSLSTSDLAYIQGMGGVKFKMDLSDFDTWKDSTDYIIVKADLIIPVPEESTTFYDPFNILSLSKTVDGVNEFLSDQYYNGSYYTDYFDGQYYPESGEYRFNIAQHLQDIITGEVENTALTLYPYSTENAVRPNRVIIDQSKIKLHIQYLK